MGSPGPTPAERVSALPHPAHTGHSQRPHSPLSAPKDTCAFSLRGDAPRSSSMSHLLLTVPLYCRHLEMNTIIRKAKDLGPGHGRQVTVRIQEKSQVTANPCCILQCDTEFSNWNKPRESLKTTPHSFTHYINKGRCR